MLNKSKTTVLSLIAATALLCGTTYAQSSKPARKMAEKAAPMAKANLVETAVAAGSFNTLATALTQAGLVDTLATGGPFTVFAPTDEAFAKIDKDTLNALIADKEALKKVLLYHVVDGKVMATDVVKLKETKTLSGEKLTINAGDKVTVNNATVIKTDVTASNGVIHVIDTVLLPPPASDAATKSIVGTAVAAGNFTTLATALTEAGLVETLDTGKGPFTVFAPTDEAFAKLPAGTLDALLKDKEQLKQILLLHVVEGNVTAGDVVKLKEAKTLSGEKVRIAVDGNTVTINNAKVVKTDIKASNGIIHVVDSVILP